MNYKMKSLKHNGIYVPPYDYKGFTIKIQGQPIKLSPKTEQMALAWVRKEQSPTSPPDKLFFKNFIQIFLNELEAENPSSKILQDFAVNNPADSVTDGKFSERAGIDFSEIRTYLLEEQNKKLNMVKEEKKKLTQERKAKREKLKEYYGFAEVDGRRIEVANWTAEPSCLFAGRGDHPRRGAWKEGPREEDIILNLSDTKTPPSGKWKDVVWEPTRMYLAKWDDKLIGKIKYVWFSDSAFLKQNKEKEKYEKASKLGSKIPKIEAHIVKNLDDKDVTRRKVATVSWLVHTVNIRVGDEKDPGEADTVGAITLRPEHIKIVGNVLHFDFLGKDAVRWVKETEAPPSVIRNIEEFAKTCKEYLFEGIDSKRVSRFLSEVMPGLTAKVFRTWRCTKTVREKLDDCKAKKEDPDYAKQFVAKIANLEAAKVANHKRKIPANYDERVAKKEANLKQLEAQLKEKETAGKKTEALVKRLEKAKLDAKLSKETKEYNLGTSLKSYVDPMAYVEWANAVEFPLDKFYPKALKDKYSWALAKCRFSSEIRKKK